MTHAPTISSASNPLPKRIRRLSSAKHRRRERAFVVEGVQPVVRAIEGKADIETIIAAPDLIEGSFTHELLQTQRQGGTHIDLVTADLFASLSDRDGPSGIMAIVRQPTHGLDTLDLGSDGLIVGLLNVANPGNLGTIIRTANAVGADAVVVLGSSTDIYAPACVKASMGAMFDTPVVRESSVDRFFEWAAANDVVIGATSARAAVPLWEVDLPDRFAALFGNEGAGLPQEVIERSAVRITIPMVGTVSSLNLAIAAGIVLYECHRRRTTT